MGGGQTDESFRRNVRPVAVLDGAPTIGPDAGGRSATPTKKQTSPTGICSS
jgi:hypothetical protein